MTHPELHAQTFPIEAGAAESFAAAAVEMCTSASHRSYLSTDADHGRSSLTRHGVVLESAERLVVGLGIAGRVSLPGGTSDAASVTKAFRALAAISCVDPIFRPGSVPIALGALPFDPTAPGELVVPELTFVREAGGLCWVTVVGRGRLEVPELIGWSGEQPPHEIAADDRSLGVTYDEGDAAFVSAVEAALEQISAGRVKKVVITRRMVAEFAGPVDIKSTLAALRLREMSSTIFAVNSQVGSFIGASPELLVSRMGPTVHSVPLAGTVRKTGVSAEDDVVIANMLRSEKENHEHRFVVDAVAEILSKWCSPLQVPPSPEVLRLRQIAHLATRLSGTLYGEPADWPSALELAAALNPTPAVGGSPCAAALELIEDLEPKGRGLFAGPVGWVDANGDGEFMIGIRSAEVTGSTACVYAGAGIVEGSDPLDELAETYTKLETMRDSLSTS